MACSIICSILILFLFSVFSVTTCLSISANCSARVSYIYCLDSGLPSTWYNNNSVIMDGWQMRVFLVMQEANNNVDLYSGFYCNGACDSYVFSVVAVTEGNHSVVWSANRDRPVKANASVRLTTQGLELRDSDGSSVWRSGNISSGNNTNNGNVVGMNLKEEGNLALFKDDNTTIWQSPADRNALILNSPAPPPPPSSDKENTTNVQPSPTDFIPNPTDLIPSPLPESPAPPGGHKIKKLATIVGSTAGGVLVASLVGVILRVKWKKKKAEEDVEEEEYSFTLVPAGMPMRFSYDDLRNATWDFKERLGGGGFGSVFKGELKDGTMIAVKRLDRMGQGVREFLAEVETIGNLHHFNLVRLIGFCAEKSCRLLVYEYMRNGSLDNWIFCKDRRPSLNWQTRKKIILDVAKGLAYLHEDCRQKIMHLDIKPQNILLDENFNAKVSDFGLSKLIDREESQVQITMRGTPGYLAPEWREMRITVKVDIYSFGIVLLETLFQRRNADPSRSESSFLLLQMLQMKAKEHRLIDIVDDLDEDMENNREEVERMIRIGAWCLQDDEARRPSMSTVVKALEGVMDVDSNIRYEFAHAMVFPSHVVRDHVLTVPPASVLSNPR